MSVKLNKEHFCLNTAICSRYMQTTVESDVIVPDIKPDILKILQCGSEVAITRREVQAGKVFVQGVVRMNILYVPDNGVGGIKSISAEQEFNHLMDIPDATVGMELFAEADAAPAEYTLVNSRKLQLRTKVGISARLLSPSEIDIAAGVDDSCKIETKNKTMKLYNPCINQCRGILVRERLEIPSGKPCICEVLKISAKPYIAEFKALDGKAMAKGELKICTLYCGEGDDSRPEVMEHTLPFSELLEIDGLREGMDAETDLKLKDLYYEVCPDSDGDRKIISIEASLEAEVRAFEAIECSAIEDAYCPQHPIELKKDTYHIEQLIASSTNQEALKETVSVPDYLPDVHCMCECSATPTIENVAVDMGEVMVSGYLHCNILYLTEDPTTPACGFAHILPFSQRYTVDGASHTSVCDAKAEVEHISCTISSGKTLEIRAIVSTSIKVVEPIATELVSEIHCNETAVLPKMPSMSVYFVQKGDTLWSIAKKYRTSPDSILSANGESADNIRTGKCIYIFR